MGVAVRSDVVAAVRSVVSPAVIRPVVSRVVTHPEVSQVLTHLVASRVAICPEVSQVAIRLVAVVTEVAEAADKTQRTQKEDHPILFFLSSLSSLSFGVNDGAGSCPADYNLMLHCGARLEDHEYRKRTLTKGLFVSPTSLHPKTSLNVNNDRTKQTKKAGPFTNHPFTLWQSIKNLFFLTTYEFLILVYSIPKEKDMIGISTISPNLFPQL